jgi:hypothetical protein
MTNDWEKQGYSHAYTYHKARVNIDPDVETKWFPSPEDKEAFLRGYSKGMLDTLEDKPFNPEKLTKEEKVLGLNFVDSDSREKILIDVKAIRWMAIQSLKPKERTLLICLKGGNSICLTEGCLVDTTIDEVFDRVRLLKS